MALCSGVICCRSPSRISLSDACCLGRIALCGHGVDPRSARCLGHRLKITEAPSSSNLQRFREAERTVLAQVPEINARKYWSSLEFHCSEFQRTVSPLVLLRESTEDSLLQQSSWSLLEGPVLLDLKRGALTPSVATHYRAATGLGGFPSQKLCVSNRG